MKKYLADLHVHTLVSPDGRSSQKALVEAAKRAGLDAIAITDHDRCTPVEPAEDILLIPGVEISTQAGHITGLFLQEEIAMEKLGRLPPPEKAVEAIHAAGGLAVLAHPYQKPGAKPEAFSFPLDGIEAANARAALKVREANQLASNLAAKRGLSSVGGSDAHDQAEVGNAYTELTAQALTLEGLREALAAGRSRAVLRQNTPYLRKGLSQWTKARRAGGIKNLARGTIYLCWCWLKDQLSNGSTHI